MARRPHRRQADLPEVLVFHVDFMFIGEAEGGDKLTILLVKERTSRMLAVANVPRKSSDECAAKCVQRA